MRQRSKVNFPLEGARGNKMSLWGRRGCTKVRNVHWSVHALSENKFAPTKR